MVKILQKIIKNIWSIIISGISAYILISHICPFLKNNIINNLELISAVFILILIFSWKKVRREWVKYRRTFQILYCEYNFLDYIITILLISIILAISFKYKSVINLFVDHWITLSIDIGASLIWLISSLVIKEGVSGDEEIKNYFSLSLSDEPIKYIEQDMLGRGEFIENLHKDIISLPFNDSFVFGLHGGWGKGKTSIINILSNKFKANKDYLTVKFDPWYYKNEEAMLKAFYREINFCISSRYIVDNFSHIIRKYQKIIATGLSNFGITMHYIYQEESLENIRSRIEDIIVKKIKKKIVVFIDDIDRLSPQEIMLVFKLIRLNAKFKNTVFVLSFDIDYVCNIMDETWTTTGKSEDKEVNLMHKKTNNGV